MDSNVASQAYSELCPKCQQWHDGRDHICLTVTRAELMAEIISLRRKLMIEQKCTESLRSALARFTRGHRV